MSRYSYIQVVLAEQNRQNATTILQYSAEGTPDMTGAPSADTVFGYFINARESFVQWISSQAAYFALMFRNPYSNDRDSYYTLTMRISAGSSLTGKQTYRALTALRKTLVEERRMTTEAIDDTLAECDIPVNAPDSESWRPAPTYSRAVNAPACYRTYMSVHELETYLTFPVQEEYTRYSSVIYVPATTSLRPGVELAQITAPLHVVYTVDLPQGVESSRPSVAAGERIVLTYNREGYSPVRETVIAGKPSPYVSYDGAHMIVRSGSECPLTFTRRIPFTVRSSKGGPVTGYTVTVNGRPVNTMQPYIEISDQDLRDESKVVITVSSNNFVTEKLELDPSQLNPSHPISVVLYPLEQGITLRLDFGEGRVFEMQISIEKNTPEYSQLHGGFFHGFRARRLTVPGGGEIYYVDVRSGMKPMAPAFDNVSDENAPTPPHFDKSLPVVETETESDTVQSDTTTPTRHRRTVNQRRNLPGIILTVVAVLIVLAAAIYYLMPGWFSSVSSPAAVPDSISVAATDTITAVVPAEQSSEPQVEPEQVPAQAPATAAALSQEDIAYLNSSSVWQRDSLRSADGQALYDAIVSGNIEQVVRNPYFMDKGTATNREAIRLADLIWASFGASTQRSNEKVMRELSDAKSIDLHKLYDKLARYRSPQPNTTPRPSSHN